MINLKTLPEATAQEVFDQVAKHLLTQMRKSFRSFKGAEYCVYRGDDGLKCAAGCLIADDEYDESSMERRSWYGIGAVPNDHSDLIRELQIVHDECDVSIWAERLNYVASCWQLDPRVLRGH